MGDSNRIDAFIQRLPSAWTYDRMKDVVRLRNEKGYVHSTALNYLELEDIEGGTGRILAKRSTLDVESAVTRFCSGDVLFGKLRPYLAKYCQPDFSGYCTGEILAFAPEGILGRFLYYCVGSSWFIDQCSMLAYGAKMPRVNWPKQVGLFQIPLPPRAEQQLIADYLDASCVAVVGAIRAKKKQLEILDSLRRTIITSAVLRGIGSSTTQAPTGSPWLPRIPTGWELVTLKRVAEMQTGLTLGKTYSPPLLERPYLRAANVQEGYLDLSTVTTIQVPEEVSKRCTLRPGDVLMTEGGDLDKLGRGCLWNGEIGQCLHQNHVFALRCHQHKLLPQFLAYLTASQYGRDYFEATGKRSTNLASTNSTKVGQFPIPLPALEEQVRIVSYVDRRLKELDEAAASIDRQVETLTAYRRALIHECTTGERPVSDADVARVTKNV